MKLKFTLLYFFAFSCYLRAQYSVSTQGIPSNADLAVSINTSTANANLKVLIGQNLNTSNFSIGFTDNLPDADVLIIDGKADADFSIVKSRLSNSDLSVVYGEQMINPDIRIEVIENATVDFLIYYETENYNVESVIMGLLPLINATLGYKYKAIPYYGPEGGPPAQEVQETYTIEPMLYNNMNVAHWIISINEGIVQLDDNAYFYVYDDDRYILQQWQVKNDVVVTPTTVQGHYYITKDGGIYNEAETLRAICFMPQ